jgi:hypothetical protein
MLDGSYIDLNDLLDCSGLRGPNSLHPKSPRLPASSGSPRIRSKPSNTSMQLGFPDAPLQDLSALVPFHG